MTVHFPTWPTWSYQFPQRDVKRIVGVRYYDANGEEQTYGSDKYRLAISRAGVSAFVLTDRGNLPAVESRVDAVAVEYEA